MNNKKWAALSAAAILLVHKLSAQQVTNGEGDFMRSMGKLYVVVAVILGAFVAMIIFLLFLAKKLTKLENQIHRHD